MKKTTKRFWAFYGQVYYPSGGMKDFLGSYTTLAGAMIGVSRKNKKDDQGSFEYAWAHIYDTQDRKIVWNNNDDYL